MKTSWKLIKRDEGTSDNIGSVYRSPAGQFVLAKEYFADGPSLFSWMLYKTDTGEFDATSQFVQEFATKKAAVKFVSRNAT